MTKSTDIAMPPPRPDPAAGLPHVSQPAQNPRFDRPGPTPAFERAFSSAIVEAPLAFLALTVLVAAIPNLLLPGGAFSFSVLMIGIIAQALALPAYLVIGVRLARKALVRLDSHPGSPHLRLLIAGWATNVLAAALYFIVVLLITLNAGAALAFAAFCLKCGFIYSTLFAPLFAWRFLRAARKQIPTSEKET
ncbi:MAG: hypothetical protein AAGD47_07810 [Pseudomonadota bacterium]